MALRWGIVTTSKISSDFAACLRSLPESHKVVAVAARDIDRAKKFADTHVIPQAYEGYEEIAKDPNIDIAYIGSLNNFHHEQTLLMLRHGKHVVCEKPMGSTQEQVKEVVALAREKNLFLMEAIWSRFFPAYHKVREVLASGQLGQVKLVTANFGIDALHVPRLTAKDTSGGAILDVGIYPIQLASMVYGGQQPTSVSTSGCLLDSGVDETSCTVIKYPNNSMAVLNASLGCPFPNEAYIIGTKKKLKIPEPLWCPTRIEISDADNNVEVHEFPLPEIKWDFKYPPNREGMQYMAVAVGNCIKEGAKESPLMTQNESILLAGIMDKARHDLGYYYDNEQK